MSKYQITYATRIYEDVQSLDEFAGKSFETVDDTPESVEEGLQKLLNHEGWFVWSIQRHIRHKKVGLMAVMKPAESEDDTTVPSIYVHFGVRGIQEPHPISYYGPECTLNRIRHLIEKIAEIDPNELTGVEVGVGLYRHELSPIELAQQLANKALIDLEREKSMRPMVQLDWELKSIVRGE